MTDSHRKAITGAAALALCLAALSCKDKERKLPPPMLDERPTPSASARPIPPAPAPKHAATEEKEAPGPIQRKPDPGCRPEMARIAGFCIDRWEVHLVDKRTREKHPENIVPTREIGNLEAVSAPDKYPQGHMSQIVARQACRSTGKRLCTSDEWQLACRGKEGRRFPYGNEKKKGVCNVHKTPYILDKLFPDIPHKKRMGRQFNSPDVLLEPGYLSMTGEYGSCATPEGVFDMDGNLSEWVDETKGEFGVFMGDPFSGKGRSGCGRVVDVHLQKYLDYSLGTRCCSNISRGTSRSPRE